MNKKQIIGIVVAAVLIVFVGVTGVISNVIKSKFEAKSEKESSKAFEELFSDTFDVDAPDEPYIGQIDIVGTIQGSEGSSYMIKSGQYNHDLYMEFVDEMIDDPNNKGIYLNVNSGGGTAFHSDELYLKLMEYKEKTERPIYAYFGDMACSGAYYISMASDKIYENRSGWTGSIGVIISMYNYSKLFKKLGVEEVDIVSGNNKTMGSSGKEMTEENKEIFQGLVDEAFDIFVDCVVEGRGLDEATVRKLADGRIYSPKQALENGLIDEIGSDVDTMNALNEAVGNPNITYYAPEGDELSSLFSSIFAKFESAQKKSDLEIASELMENPKNGVIMYEAR